MFNLKQDCGHRLVLCPKHLAPRDSAIHPSKRLPLQPCDAQGMQPRQQGMARRKPHHSIPLHRSHFFIGQGRLAISLYQHTIQHRGSYPRNYGQERPLALRVEPNAGPPLVPFCDVGYLHQAIEPRYLRLCRLHKCRVNIEGTAGSFLAPRRIRIESPRPLRAHRTKPNLATLGHIDCLLFCRLRAATGLDPRTLHCSKVVQNIFWSGGEPLEDEDLPESSERPPR